MKLTEEEIRKIGRKMGAVSAYGKLKAECGENDGLFEKLK